MTALVFALVAALGNLAGGWAVVRHERKSLAAIELFLAFGAGFMLSVALLEVAPEAMSRDPRAPLYILVGYLAVHLAQHVLVPHFHFGEETHMHADLARDHVPIDHVAQVETGLHHGDLRLAAAGAQQSRPHQGQRQQTHPSFHDNSPFSGFTVGGPKRA